MKFYTYRQSESARADCANSRDARTVNPDENKLYPRKAISGSISVAFWTALERCASDIGCYELQGNNRILHNMRDPLQSELYWKTKIKK